MPPHLIAEEGPFKGKLLKFEGKEEWIIGRDPDLADFVLEDTTVSRKHLLCKKEGETILIRNLSKTNPVLVNDQAIEGDYLLKEGDHVKLGQTIFIYSEEEIPLLEETPIEPSLEGETGEEQIKEEEEEIVEPSDLAPSYETIFEPNMDEEEEISLQAIKETPFFLKVISGPNTGAEFGMELGKEYILGKDPDSCDIAFNDMSVSRKHAKISIDNHRKIYIEDLGSKNKTIVNSGPIEGKKEILPNDLIAIGTSIFLIIDKEAPSETIYSEVGALQRISTPQKEEEKEAALALKKEEFDWRKVIIPKSVLFLSGTFLLILFFVFLSLFSLVKSHKVEVATKDATKELKKIMEKYQGIEFSYNPKNQSLFLLGHILTSIDHEEMLYSLQQIPSIDHLEDNIIIDEFVWKNMNDLLSDNAAWRGINIHSPTPGKFVLSGYVKQSGDAEELMNYLRIHFPYTDRLENHVVVETILNAQIATTLAARGFSGISFQLTNGELILIGNYDIKTTDQFHALVKGLKTLDGVRSIKDLAIGASANAARIDLTGKYQITGFASQGKENFGVVINGQIITIGELLDGMKVTAIEPNIILLQKENLKYKINYIR